LSDAAAMIQPAELEKGTLYIGLMYEDDNHT
jgi:hypothetical protein